MSYLSALCCSECGQKFDPGLVQTYCKDCNAPLLANYDLEKAAQYLNKDEFHLRPRGMWRWKELLPVNNKGSIIDLGEGDTPLLHTDRLGRISA